MGAYTLLSHLLIVLFQENLISQLVLRLTDDVQSQEAVNWRKWLLCTLLKMSQPLEQKHWPATFSLINTPVRGFIRPRFLSTQWRDRYKRGMLLLKVGVRPVGKTYHRPDRVEKNRSFPTCEVKPEAQKTTGHVETRGKTHSRQCLCSCVGLMQLWDWA